MNIESVVDENLCIQCGMCSALCPKNCISIKKNNYDYLPQIEKAKCVDCSLCSKVCSKSCLGVSKNSSTVNEEYILGDYINIYHAKTKDKNILKSSVSGGIVTTIIKRLLEKDIYDSAFLLDKYSYETQLQTVRFTKNESLINTPKSRYLTVSHYNSVKYIKEHPNEKIILVGTSCIISSFLKLIQILNLNRDNYLFIGLFCDKTMNYGVYEYFKQHKASKNKVLKNLLFRTKEAGNWPGNIRLEYEDGSIIDLDKKERMKVKEYFVPERCLYCLDKLNKNADISVGDNYIPEFFDEEGMNCVVIRTKKADELWTVLSKEFIFAEDKKEKLIQAQGVNARIKKNLQFAKIKGLADGKYSIKDRKAYLKILKKIKLGKNKKLYLRIKMDIFFNKILLKLAKNK